MNSTDHVIDGVRLAVARRGDGPPILFQHGLGGDANQTADVFPEGFGLITVECRGHGRSAAGDPSAFGLATFASDIACFLDEVRLGPLVVGGLSMGAAITLRLAVRRPDLVKALVLVRPAWITEAAPRNLSANALVGDLLTRFSPDEALRRFEQSDVAAALAVTAPANLASLRRFFAREPTAVTAALLSRIAADGPSVSREELAELTVPTLVIGHDEDAVHPLALARDLAGLIPRASFVEVTPRARNKSRYRADVRAALHKFFSVHV